jgi:urease accessory protein
MRSLVIATALLAPLPALAHPGHAETLGFVAGLLHPFSGLDHIVAMLMVGLWAGTSGGRARVALPGAFLGAMLVGFLLGGTALPGVEAGILASTLMLVALAALAAPLPLGLSVALVALAGLVHGHAHGAEGALTADYALGMLAGSGMLLAAGVGLASPLGPLARRFGALVLGRTA